MTDPTKDPSLISDMMERGRMIRDQMPEQVGALILAGAAGAYVRAVFAPLAPWRRRIMEGVAGAFGAIFLGGLVGHLIEAATGAGTWAYLAAGFIMGEGGIAAMRGVRKAVLRKGDS